MGKQNTVLIVDDSPQNILVLTSLLEADFKVKAATNGNRALALAGNRDNRPEIILLDVQMPGMDGYEVCERIKADPATSDIPIIFITALTETQDEAKGFLLGAVDYIHKPFDPVIVRARIKTQLALYEALRRAEETQRRADELLEIMLPREAANELRKTGSVIPRRFDMVAVLFCDIANFTEYCNRHEPEEVVSRLDALYVRFDQLTHRHGMEKIKTIGDCYMASANLLTPHAEPVEAAVSCGLEMRTATTEMTLGCWETRIGVHVGPVIAGIVGLERYQFDLWGDTVNVAARLSSVGPPGGVTVTESVWQRIADRFAGEALPPLDIKGKGPILAHHVQRRR